MPRQHLARRSLVGSSSGVWPSDAGDDRAASAFTPIQNLGALYLDGKMPSKLVRALNSGLLTPLVKSVNVTLSRTLRWPALKPLGPTSNNNFELRMTFLRVGSWCVVPPSLSLSVAGGNVLSRCECLSFFPPRPPRGSSNFFSFSHSLYLFPVSPREFFAPSSQFIPPSFLFLRLHRMRQRQIT